jgi:hypothetical protein
MGRPATVSKLRACPHTRLTKPPKLTPKPPPFTTVQVVITPHVYPPSITMATFLGATLWDQCRSAFGYLATQGYCPGGGAGCRRFPLLIGETGSAYETDADKEWLRDFADFINAEVRGLVLGFLALKHCVDTAVGDLAAAANAAAALSLSPCRSIPSHPTHATGTTPERRQGVQHRPRHRLALVGVQPE